MIFERRRTDQHDGGGGGASIVMFGDGVEKGVKNRGKRRERVEKKKQTKKIELEFRFWAQIFECFPLRFPGKFAIFQTFLSFGDG